MFRKIDLAMTREEAIKRIKAWDLDSDDREVLEVIIPELRESEDERIRKELIKVVSDIAGDWPFEKHEITKKEALAYLEKQKESQENCTKFLAKILKHSAEGFRNVLKKKGIDYIPSESFWTGTAGTYSKQECNEFYKWMADMTMELVTEETPEYKKGFKDGLAASKKEQKPAESISQLTVQDKGVYKICPRCKSRMIRDDSKVYISMPPQYGYECPKCGKMEFDTVMYDNPEMEEQKPVVTHGETYHVDTLGTQQVIAGKMPQKPAEWSEEDKKMLNHLIDKVQENWNIRMPNGHYFGITNDEKETFSSWLRHLPERFNLSLKQEWSEEDEKKITFLERLIRHNVPEGQYGWTDGHKGGFISKSEAISKLKSLHPSWKPSEQERGALRTAIHVLTEQRDFPKTAEQLQAILDAFEGKESRKDWKPSREQMEVYLDENTMKKEFRMIDSACLLFHYDKLNREQLIARRFYRLGRLSNKK